MTRAMLTCLLALLFCLSGPAVEGNAGFPQSSLAAETTADAERLVIGRGADLAKSGELGPGEFKFSWPPTGAAQTEWKVNSGLLRQEMGNMRPIRDASAGNTGGMYLNRG